jgi:hypothetical protein
VNITCRVKRLPRAALAAAVAGALARVAFAAPSGLSDAALDTVTAGNPTEPAAGKVPVAIVTDGARYTFAGGESVRLHGSAQARLHALNAVAAAGSDVGNALNLLALDTGVTADASQQNSLRQSEAASGSLGSASLLGAMVSRTERLESRFTTGGSDLVIGGHRLRTSSHERSVEQYAASVPAFSPLEKLKLSFDTPELPDITFGPFTVALFTDSRDEDDGNDQFGLRGSLGPFTLKGAELELGTVSLDGDDVVLTSGYVQLPEIDLGTAQLKVCFVACIDSGEVELGEVPGRRVDFPLDDLRLEGANIFKDTQINAGSGMALVGAGSVNVVPSHVTLTAELTLDLPDPVFSFDFTIPAHEDEDGEDIIGPWTVDGPDVTIEIPPVSFSHTLVDDDVGAAFSGRFDGVLCIGTRSMDCATSSRSTEQRRFVEDVAVSAVAGSSHDEGGESVDARTQVHAGATLSSAGADLIAMSQASADVASTNSVALDESAQRGLRAVNAVNAANALIGNALNVSAVRPSSSPGGGAGSLLSQTNSFSQYRTRYGL